MAAFFFLPACDVLLSFFFHWHLRLPEACAFFKTEERAFAGLPDAFASLNYSNLS